MILSSFSYSAKDWRLEGMNAVQQTNLLVGKNASGKTRTLKALQRVTSLLLMRPLLENEPYIGARLTFSEPADANWGMNYSFTLARGEVINEELDVCGISLIKREGEQAEMKGETITPPKDKLVVQVRRDRNAYPEVETLIEWAEGVNMISCSDINPLTILKGLSNFVSPIPFSDLVNALTEEDGKKLIAEAKQLGYHLRNIGTVQANSELKLVAVREESVSDMLVDFQLSSGMLRVLYILCFLEYVKKKKGQLTLLIDDLGEGLDYSRATLLGKKVFEVCEKEGVQLIASSNDSFMMDVVDISKWQIIRRDNKRLTVLNQTNTPELFQRFRMTGLSNFDLFSSDFIDNYLARKSE